MEPSREKYTYPLTSEDFFMEDDEVDISFTSEYFTAQSNVDSNAVENITIESSDCSSVSDKLNDTIEEMERLLKNSEKVLQNKPYDFISSESNVESIDLENMMLNEEQDKIVPLMEHREKLYNFKTPKMTSKLPKQVNTLKNPAKSNIFRTSPNYKTIVSPVAMYIKNSARTPLKHNVPAKQLPLRHLNAGAPHNKFNKQTHEFLLPTVTYKPTKTAIVSHEMGQKIPESIKKYIPQKPEVIKHEGRMLNKNSIEPEKKILMEDLTLMDSTLLQLSSQDISMLAVKNAF